jgi:RHS repeat-associated protein
MVDPGADSNRSSVTIDGATTDYCYGPGDRLTSTSGAAAVGAVGYDVHGNTTSVGGDTYSWDDADRHTSTTAGATTVTYQRDATGRVVGRTVGGVTTGYVYAAGGDSPAAVLDNTGAVTARTLGLPGGVTVTRQTAGDTWAYPNIHGDVAATTTAMGVKVGATLRYDPFGNPIAGVADDLPGDYDYAWLGTKTRPVEHQAGLRPTIEMGARPYDPQLGRFLTIDPVPGGSANNYDYTNQNPIGATDLGGTMTDYGNGYIAVNPPEDLPVNRRRGQHTSISCTGMPSRFSTLICSGGRAVGPGTAANRYTHAFFPQPRKEAHGLLAAINRVGRAMWSAVSSPGVDGTIFKFYQLLTAGGRTVPGPAPGPVIIPRDVICRVSPHAPGCATPAA